MAKRCSLHILVLKFSQVRTHPIVHCDVTIALLEHKADCLRLQCTHLSHRHTWETP